MPTVINGSTGVTFPAGGVGNPAGAVVGTTDTQSLTNKSFDSAAVPTVAGTAPLYFCRAWVDFNGTTNVGGFCTIKASGNVSSVADNGAGDYTVNFSTAMPDANYGFAASCQGAGSGNTFIGVEQNSATTPTTSAIRFLVKQGGTSLDRDYVCVSIFR